MRVNLAAFLSIIVRPDDTERPVQLLVNVEGPTGPCGQFSALIGSADAAKLKAGDTLPLYLELPDAAVDMAPLPANDTPSA